MFGPSMIDNGKELRQRSFARRKQYFLAGKTYVLRRIAHFLESFTF
jgi:hypothetical protein